MVEVTVCVYRHNGLKAVCLDKLLEDAVLALNHVTRIDNDALLGVVPSDICILSKWVKNQSFNLHNTLFLFFDFCLKRNVLHAICCRRVDLQHAVEATHRGLRGVHGDGQRTTLRG